jgi:hypothetical protein
MQQEFDNESGVDTEQQNRNHPGKSSQRHMAYSASCAQPQGEFTGLP